MQNMKNNLLEILSVCLCMFLLQIIYSADGTVVRGESRRGRGKGRGGVSTIYMLQNLVS